MAKKQRVRDLINIVNFENGQVRVKITDDKRMVQTTWRQLKDCLPEEHDREIAYVGIFNRADDGALCVRIELEKKEAE